ncbi:hypothetical protein GCM10010329_03830 [Streptomyces spiroverticillatus]|uniref:RDD domain-containing protein n=2 Tax=Streptomyces finlayi TaxID=67296 RepID=A0A919C769_9ACTN|nr:hypothetical protein GCM10010329_03830 [Streptomyces spiroverticillatus]GHC78481.1 hypothetical protein GCM10010334_03810 [Streptomyces finlayi]
MIALFGGPRIFPPDAATMSGPEMFGVLVVAVVGTSLVNQYVLTLLFRGSVGKLITGIRVVRAADGGRPGPIRTLVRWLGGLCWIPLQPWYWLRDFFRMASGSRSTPRGTLGDNVEGDLYDDMAGLRYVRRKDL